MELGYDGNAATVLPKQKPKPEKASAPEIEIPKTQKRGRRSRELVHSAKGAAKAVTSAAVAPKAVVGILVVAIVVMMMLISHAQLVMINDEAVALRSELSQLQSEGAKLKVQYELTYDLQEIENRMLTSGQMITIQNWQTYVLELSEPDHVEYYQSHGGLSHRIITAIKSAVSAVKEYF